MTLILYHQPVHRHKAVELYVPAPRVSARLRGLGVKDHDLSGASWPKVLAPHGSRGPKLLLLDYTHIMSKAPHTPHS